MTKRTSLNFEQMSDREFKDWCRRYSRRNLWFEVGFVAVLSLVLAGVLAFAAWWS